MTKEIEDVAESTRLLVTEATELANQLSAILDRVAVQLAEAERELAEGETHE